MLASLMQIMKSSSRNITDSWLHALCTIHCSPQCHALMYQMLTFLCVHAANVSIMGVQYPLYTHVHHGYGLNDAFDRSVTLLLESEAPANKPPSNHPPNSQAAAQHTDNPDSTPGAAMAEFPPESDRCLPWPHIISLPRVFPCWHHLCMYANKRYCWSRENARSSEESMPEEESLGRNPDVMRETNLQAIFEQGSGPMPPRGLLEADDSLAASDAEVNGRSLLARGAPEALPQDPSAHGALYSDDLVEKEEKDSKSDDTRRRMAERLSLGHPCLHEGYTAPYRRLLTHEGILPKPAILQLEGR